MGRTRASSRLGSRQQPLSREELAAHARDLRAMLFPRPGGSITMICSHARKAGMGKREHTSIAIIGGGFAGLCAGIYAQKNGYRAHV